jgi:hypothetical protein
MKPLTSILSPLRGEAGAGLNGYPRSEVEKRREGRLALAKGEGEE